MNVQRLDGVSVGGRKLSDHRQIENLGEASKTLFAMVRDGTFMHDRQTSNRLHALVAAGEALDPGLFRGEGDPLNATPAPHVPPGKAERDIPPLTQPGGADLKDMYAAGLDRLAEIGNPLERGMAHFLHHSAAPVLF